MVNLKSCADTAGCTSGNYDIAYTDDQPQCPKPLVLPDRDDPTYPIDGKVDLRQNWHWCVQLITHAIPMPSVGTECALPCLSFFFSDEEDRKSTRLNSSD